MTMLYKRFAKNENVIKVTTVQNKLLKRVCRSSHQSCSIDIGVLKKLHKIHRKAPVPESAVIISWGLGVGNETKNVKLTLRMMAKGLW